MNRLDFRESEAVTIDRRTAKEVLFTCDDEADTDKNVNIVMRG